MLGVLAPKGTAPAIVQRLQDATLDYTESQGLVIRNPNRPQAPAVEGLTRDDELFDVLKKRRDMTGAVPGTFEAWLALRGMRTLHVRLERAQSNAQELVRRLDEAGAAKRPVIRQPL